MRTSACSPSAADSKTARSPADLADIPPPGRGAVSPASVGSAASAVSARQLETIALAAVRLAAMGPRLAVLAGRTEEQADVQARHAEQIASATRELSERLGAVVGRLQGASANVQDVVDEIARIADQTRILSINASIEAARAGEQGRAFTVVAHEVQELADQTRGSTRLIGERVQAIQDSVRLVAESVKQQAKGATVITVQSVNTQVQAMAVTAEGQRDGARSLRTLSDQANSLTEELLLAVGRFRLMVHRRAAEEIQVFLPRLVPLLDHRMQLETALHGWLEAHPEFELLYVTNAEGCQITANIGWKEGVAHAEPSSCGRDWRDRPWYKDAMRRPEAVASTDIYRSAATGDFCFTVSAVVRNPSGAPLGVLGADVNFQKLVAGDASR
jgi:hypothetical protein